MMSNANEFNEKFKAHRMAEIEASEEVRAMLKEAYEKKIWKESGYRSLTEYLESKFNYDPAELRDHLIAIGAILPEAQLVSEDPKLQTRINELKAWRKQKAAGLAAYRIMTNRTLLELAEKLPQSREQLAQINGLGEKKLRDFGDELLTLCGLLKLNEN